MDGFYHLSREGFSAAIAGLLPAVAFAQGGDVRDVMFSVPGVEGERVVERHGLFVFRVTEFSRPVERRERLEQKNPALVQTFRIARDGSMGELLPSDNSAQRASSYGLIVGSSSVSASFMRT
jgi:hypothetical protein